MRPVHAGVKGVATLPPILNMTEETQIYFQHIYSPESQLPNAPMSFPDQRAGRLIAHRLDTSTKKRYRPPVTHIEQEVCDDKSLSQ